MAQQMQRFTGRVNDPTGAVVAKATVIAHNLDTGVDITTTTTSTGDYTIPYVIPGHYSVSVQAAGFNTAIHTGIVLQVDQVAKVPIPFRTTTSWRHMMSAAIATCSGS
jgi:hypothetical protein